MEPTRLLAFMFVAAMAASLSMVPAFSVPDQANPKAAEMTTVSIPQNAKKIGPGVYDLGVQIHNGKLVQGTLFVFSDEQFAKPDGNPGKGNKGGGGGEETSTCFSYITKGAKWRTEEPWNVSTTNAPASIINNVIPILEGAVNEWEDPEQDGEDLHSIIAPRDSNIVVDATSFGTMNEQNEVAFGDIENTGVIAATWVWRTISGPPQARYIAEWDQLYDVVSFAWSLNGASGTMDFDNIATHELGHSVGMGHPDSTCTLETMYAYADYTEIIKRDLYTGDIAGVNGLY